MPGTAFYCQLESGEQSGIHFLLPKHAPLQTVEDATQNLLFEVARIVKTIAFRTRNGGLVLAVIRASKRIDYPWLAALVGINRRDLAPLSPVEVRELLT